MDFITVYESEDGDPVEIPMEDDLTVLFTTLSGQFPKVSGLKYRCSGSNNFRAVKFSEGKLFPPTEGRNELKFICVFPKETADNKRKYKEEYEFGTPKTKRLEGKKCTDLIVLNLGWKVTEEILKEYFGKFGELVLVQVKKDRDTNLSKGYAFVRFAEYESQVLCLADKHLIDGRWCAVKVPFSKSEADKQEVSRKIHVSYSSEEIGIDDLRKAFEEYGYVSDIFIPKPFRNFAFVTFESSDVAQQLIGHSLAVKGFPVTIGSAVPKISGASKRQGVMAQGPYVPHGHLYQQQQPPMYSYSEQQAAAAAAAMMGGFPVRYGWASPPSASSLSSYEAALAMQGSSPYNAGSGGGRLRHGRHAGMYGGHHSSYQQHGGGEGGGRYRHSHYGNQHSSIASHHYSNNGCGHYNGFMGGSPNRSQNPHQSQYVTGPSASPNGMHQLHSTTPNLISCIEYSAQQQQQQQKPSDMGQNTAAMAALNILNNPEVVAAIVAAANKTGDSLYPQQAQNGGATPL